MMDNDDRIAQWKAKREKAAKSGAADRKLSSASLASLRKQQTAEATEQELEDRKRVLEAEVPAFGEAVAGASVLKALDARRSRSSRLTGLIIAVSMILALGYSLFILTPLKTAEASLSIQRLGVPEPASSGVLGIGGGANKEAYEIKALLESAQAMRELEARTSFLKGFSRGTDPFTRPGRSSFLGRDELSFYRGRVDAKVDPQSGIITLSVEGRTETDALEASGALVDIATAYVENRSQRLVDAQLSSNSRRVEDARLRVDGLLEDLAVLMRSGGERDTTGDTNARLQRVGRLEAELTDVETQLAALAEANIVSGARVSGLEGRRGSLRSTLQQARRAAAQRDGISDTRQREAAIARKELDIELARQEYTAALASYDTLLQQIDGQRAELTTVAGPEARGVPNIRRSVFYFLSLAVSLLALAFLISIPLRSLSVRGLGRD